MSAFLFACPAPSSRDELPFEQWLGDVPEPKRTRIRQQKNTQAAITQLCSDRLLAYALFMCRGLDARELERQDEPGGKPSFVDPRAPHFSLSHSGRFALCALADSPIGADVERIRPIKDEVARRVLSDLEYREYLASKDPEQYFFWLWVLKESYLKLTGAGLSGGLKEACFSLSDFEKPRFTLPGYFFQLYRLDKDYQASACIQNGTLPHDVTIVKTHQLATIFS